MAHTDAMGFLDRIKKAFATGGIGVDVSTPEAFRWSDNTLPVDVAITNSSDEPRTVTSVRLQLAEYDRDDPVTTRKVRGRYEGMNLFVNETFSVDAGGSHTMHIDMPLSVEGAAEGMGVEDAPDWVKGISTVVNTVTELNRENEWYILRVIPEVEGFTAKKIGSRRIRNLRAGEWGRGMFRVSVE